jgi:hypothetical protein
MIFWIEFACARIDTNPPSASIIKALQIYSVIGRDSIISLSQSGISYYRIFPVYLNGNYTYKCGLITKEKGLFSLGITPFQNEETLPFKIEGNCDDSPILIGCKLNGDADNNIDMLVQTHNNFEFEKQQFRRYGGYCFFVK